MAELSHEANWGQVAPPALPVSVETVTERLSRFRCVGCGYGASCKIAPERCPMCSGKTWEYEDKRWSAELDRPIRRDSTL
jgi:rubrerythrin